MNRTPTTAVLLAAGRGKRLRPHTDLTPKPLLRLHGRPLLDYVLAATARAGIDTVCLVTHHLGAQIEQYVGNGAAWGLTAGHCRQPELLGTAHALQAALSAYPHLFAPERPFLLTATDYALPPAYLADLLAAHQHNGADITISLKALAPAEVIGRSSVILGEDGRIAQIIEKPGPDQIDRPLAASLTFVLPGVTPQFLAQVRPSPRGELEIQDVINQMIAAGLTASCLLQETPPEWTPEPEPATQNRNYQP